MVKYRVVVEGHPFEVEILGDGSVWVDRRLCDVDLIEATGQPCHSLLLDNRSYETQVRPGEDGDWQVVVAGRPYRTSLGPSRGSPGGSAPNTCSPAGERADTPLTYARLKVPLPGILVEVRVGNGDCVEEGDVVAVLESMKMHLELSAPRAGIVSDLAAVPGGEVDLGEVLAVIHQP